MKKVEISGDVYNAARSAELYELRIEVAADAIQSVQSGPAAINPRSNTTTTTADT